MNKSSIRLILQPLIIITLFFISNKAIAEKYLIISDLDHPYHQNLVKLLENGLKESQLDSDNISDDELASQTLANYSSLITIGYKAAASVIKQQTSKPVLSLLIPKLAFNLLLNKNISKEKHYLYSCIYIDQPIDRQVRLINTLSTSFKKIGILFGKNSYSRKKVIISAIKNSGFDVNHITVLERTALISETRYLSENSDLLLAIPDSTIYNRRSIKGILLTTYRNKIPVIGFSRAYVKAGALAAVYSSPENISQQAIETLISNTRHSYISASRTHPKYFDIEINKNVARSLNINIQNKSQLLRYLIGAESSSGTPLLPVKGNSEHG